MIDRGVAGAIVNMGSTLGHGGQPRAIAYSAAKGAILNLTRSLAVELAPHRIRVNSVSPGRSGTATLSGEPDEEPRGLNPDPSGIPMKRYGNPQDQANAILFLVSDDAAFITGADLRVDGGALATWGDGK
jgi:NAD(P)-dependent dehydrogenase (short-subunit alcohol dehydrogenase family)